jgi:glycosyltransferase involved in cell wall biosynthesis/GT2 family glycosyltransferase
VTGRRGGEPVATVLITTRDRRDRLRDALRSVDAQTAKVEIIVLDDASGDGTADMVAREFPHAKVVRSEIPLGCPAQRNLGFELARAPIVICLDDDARFSSSRTVAQVVNEFDDDRIAVVTIPYVNVRRERHLRQQAPDGDRWIAATFAGGASALRRDAFRDVGGYADVGEHGEETDLAIRLLERGRFIRLGRADHIVHEEVHLHKPARTYFFSSRNHVLEAWRNVPWPYLPARVGVVIAKVTIVGIRDGEGRAALQGVAAAIRARVPEGAARTPVSRRAYRLARRLGRGPLPLAAITAETTPRRALRVVSILTTHAAGGAEYAAVDMLDALAHRGASVRLLTNRVDLVAGTGVHAVRIDLGPKLRQRTLARVGFEAPLNLARLVRALRHEAATDPFDVLLLHYKKEQLLSAALPRSVAGAVVWAEWGPLPRQLRDGPARRAYALAARRAAAIIAESDATARSLTDAGVDAAKVVVVPNVLSAGTLELDCAGRREQRAVWGLQDAFVLGCISRLDGAKRVDVAIDALAHLDDRVALVIAGEGENEAELRRRAAPYGSRVRFVGNVRGRIAQILSACDVQVYAPGPSEGAARAVTMGQLVERPIIATAPEGAEGLVVAGTGTILSPPHDAVALARCVEAYRADPARIREEGVAGRRHAMRRIDDANAIELLERTLRAVRPTADR